MTITEMLFVNRSRVLAAEAERDAALAVAATRKQEPLVVIIQAVEHLTNEELKDATEYLIGERMAREQRKCC